MDLYLSQSVRLPQEEIVGIFDLDNTTWSFRTRSFLERAEAAGQVVTVGDDLPRSFLLCQRGTAPATVYISQVNTATLFRRAEDDGISV